MCIAAHTVAEGRALVADHLEVPGVGRGNNVEGGEPARHQVVRQDQTLNTKVLKCDPRKPKNIVLEF